MTIAAIPEARGSFRHRGGCGGALSGRPFSGAPFPGWGVPLMVLGFIAWWPVGLAMLALMFGWRPLTARLGQDMPWRGRLLPQAGSGNLAFDAHRAEVLARLEEQRRQLDAQQAEFAEFLQQLRRAKDQAEFDRFMDGRGQPRG